MSTKQAILYAALMFSAGVLIAFIGAVDPVSKLIIIAGGFIAILAPYGIFLTMIENAD